ncbi:phage holin family protein [Candidatus Saccharibacteria bacterium]|nr:phage holin family protein [Candidatus Saccharibacteria bacterium]
MSNQSFWVKFLFRWTVSSLGLWIAAALLGSSNLSVGNRWTTVLGAGFFLALVNMALKPILVFLSIPAIILTLGLFLLIVNGLTIVIAAWLYEPLYVKSIWMAVLAALILSFVNFLVTKVVEEA